MLTAVPGRIYGEQHGRVRQEINVKNYILGIDNGGTVIKAALYDERGCEIAEAGRKTELIVPFPGHIERDMDILWKANCEAVREVLEKSRIGVGQIAGIAVTGHGNGLYMVDSQGNPVGNGILSADSRADDLVSRWEKDGTAAAVLPRTCQAIWSGQPVSILNWMKQQDPLLLSSDKIRWIFMCKDYIRYKLTGEAFAELTDYSGTQMVNVNTLDYDSEVLDIFSLGDAADKLPPLRKSTQPCGAVSREAAALTGLAAGTPVYGGLFDIDASAIGTGITRSDLLCLVAGTWSINEFISPVPIASDALFMCSAYCMPDTWLITEGSPTSACNLEWYVKRILQGKQSYRLCDEAVASLAPDASDVLFLPFLFGSNVGHHASSGFLGLKGWHHQEHMIRAVFEGVVFSHATHVDRLKPYSPDFSCARIAGGAARSKVWVQMFADILNLPIEITETKELGALGAAIAASVGAGIYPSYEQAADAMVRVSHTFQPNPEYVEIYKKKYQRYKHAVSALHDFWMYSNIIFT